MDETGCGDTFLACTVCELLNHQCSGNQQNHTHQWGEEVRSALSPPLPLSLPLFSTHGSVCVCGSSRLLSLSYYPPLTIYNMMHHHPLLLFCLYIVVCSV